MTRKPLHDDLAHGDTCNLATHSIDREAQGCQYHLCLVGTEEWNCDSASKVVTYGIPLNQSTTKHQDGGHDARETDAKLVEDNTTEEKEQEEHIEVAVCSREKSILIRRPTES